MRLIRRREAAAPPDAAEGAPADAPQILADAPQTPEEPPEPAPPPARLVVHFRGVALIAVLIAAAVLLASGALTTLPPDVVGAWPWLLAGAGGVLLLVGLVTAWPGATLGGPVLLAVGAAALLEAQFVSSAVMVLAGAVTVALGAAMLLRGLTMPRAGR